MKESLRIPHGKNLSWYTIFNALLPALEDEEKELRPPGALHRPSASTALLADTV